MDGQYRTKYFLTSKATCSQDLGLASSSVPQRDATTVMVEESAKREHEGEAHNLILSEEVSPLSNAVQDHKKLQECSTTSRTSTVGRKENQNFDDSVATFQPILPWINGDGTINGIVYRGLTRRILGIATQNPGILEVSFLYSLLCFIFAIPTSRVALLVLVLVKIAYILPDPANDRSHTCGEIVVLYSFIELYCFYI